MYAPLDEKQVAALYHLHPDGGDNDDDAIVFHRSLGPAVQAAILGWAALWSITPLGAATAADDVAEVAEPRPGQSRLAAAPPPIAVMVAGLMRRPLLDAVLEVVSRHRGSLQQQQQQQQRRNPRLPRTRMTLIGSFPPSPLLPPLQHERLVRYHRCDDFTPLLEYSCTAHAARSPSYQLQYSAPLVWRLAASGDLTAVLSVVRACSLDLEPNAPAAPAFAELRGCGLTLLAKGDVAQAIACTCAGLLAAQDEQQRPMKPVPVAIEDLRLVSMILRPHSAQAYTGYLDALKHPDALLRRRGRALVSEAADAQAAWVASLPPLGDFFSAVGGLPLQPSLWDWECVLHRLQGLVRTNVFDLITAFLGLVSIERGDVAVALAVASPRTLPTAIYYELVRELRRCELRHRVAHHGVSWRPNFYGRNPDPEVAGISAKAYLRSMWDGVGGASLTTKGSEHLAPRLFLTRVAGSVVQRWGGNGEHGASAAVVHKADFESRWEALTNGIFNGFDWRYVIAVGDAVAACLDPLIDRTAPQSTNRPAQIDLCIYGLSPEGIAAVVACVERHVRRLCEASGAEAYATFLDNRAVTFVFEALSWPRVRVETALRDSVADVILNQVLDHHCIGYDGDVVVTSARGALAWSHRANCAAPPLRLGLGLERYLTLLLQGAASQGFPVVVPTGTDEEPHQLRHVNKPAARRSSLRCRLAEFDSEPVMQTRFSRDCRLQRHPNTSFADFVQRHREQGYRVALYDDEDDVGFIAVVDTGRPLGAAPDREEWDLNRRGLAWGSRVGDRAAPQPHYGGPVDRAYLFKLLVVSDWDVVHMSSDDLQLQV
jgi:hypothetical protein